MPQINTPPRSGMFRTSVMTGVARVDRTAKVIYGANLMQVGDLNDERPWTVDMGTLQNALELMRRSNAGLKARYTHPNMSADGMGSFLGRWREPRIEGYKLVADLHLADAAFNSPQGDLGTYVEDMVEDNPDMFGVSLATRINEAEMEKLKLEKRAADPEWKGRTPLRFLSVHAADVVDEPAATRGGFFSLTEIDNRNLPAQATLLLDSYFADAEPEVVTARINGFLATYFRSKGHQMPETASTPEVPAAPAAQIDPAADLSAAAPTADVTTTTTTDFAAIERDRCKKIRALVDLAGVPEKFNLFVDNNFSVEETQAALRDIVAKKNPALASSPEPQLADPDAGLKAEYAEAVKFNVHMGLTESEYVAAHAKRRKS